MRDQHKVAQTCEVKLALCLGFVVLLKGKDSTQVFCSPHRSCCDCLPVCITPCDPVTFTCLLFVSSIFPVLSCPLYIPLSITPFASSSSSLPCLWPTCCFSSLWIFIWINKAATFPVTWRRIGTAQQVMNILWEHNPLLSPLGLIWMWEEAECIIKAALAEQFGRLPPLRPQSTFPG